MTYRLIPPKLDDAKTKFLINVKLVLIRDTYCIFILAIPLLLPHKKRNKLTLAPPWTELTQNSTVTREMTIDSHVTASLPHNFSYYYIIRIAGRVGGPSDKYAVSIAY